MRLFSGLAVGAALVGALAAGAESAKAQSFFQNFFGFGKVERPPVAQRQAPRVIPRARLYRSRPIEPFPAPEQDVVIGPPDAGGPYSIMCVRTCDGFYFPIRQNARQANFSRDVKACAASCGTEARVFYFPTRHGNVDQMIDLSGRRYSDEPNAFAYRKALRTGCSCQVAPWSAAATARHKVYDNAEALELARDKVFMLARTAAWRSRSPERLPDASAPVATNEREDGAAGDAFAHGVTPPVPHAAVPIRRSFYRVQNPGRPGWKIFGGTARPNAWSGESP